MVLLNSAGYGDIMLKYIIVAVILLCGSLSHAMNPYYGSAVSGGGFAAPTYGTSIVVDGGFEVTDTPNWTIGTSFSVTTEQANSGTHSLKLLTTSGIQYNTWQDITSLVTAGEYYRLSGFVYYVSEVSGAVYLQVLNFDASCTLNEQLWIHSPNGGFTEYTHPDFLMPSGCADVRIRAVIASSPDTIVAYFDDISLQERN